MIEQLALFPVVCEHGRAKRRNCPACRRARWVEHLAEPGVREAVNAAQRALYAERKAAGKVRTRGPEHLARTRILHAAHREKVNARQRERYRSPEAREKRQNVPDDVKEKRRRTTRMRLYALAPEDFDRILAAQCGGCALCPRIFGRLQGPLHVDHDHRTGRVRGLLCVPCNVALGLLGDDVSVIPPAFMTTLVEDYLRGPGSHTVADLAEFLWRLRPRKLHLVASGTETV